MVKNDFVKFKSTSQINWTNNHFFNALVLDNIDKEVQLHNQIQNVRSSTASCINVLGNLDEGDLLTFLNSFGLNATSIIPFPTGANVEGQQYKDRGKVVFEWIGPKESPINEKGGERGQNRTSIDAYILVEIDGKITQLFIEWKFTETYHGNDYLQKFRGGAGIERLVRYSKILADWRKEKKLPFRINDGEVLGIYDLGYEPFYQLLRMTLLAKLTTPMQLTNSVNVEDYRILHLTHSKNIELNRLCEKHLKYSPGLQRFNGEELHAVWKEKILTTQESDKFVGGYWDQAIQHIQSGNLKDYLMARYC
jgi:hypothetical protein